LAPRIYPSSGECGPNWLCRLELGSVPQHRVHNDRETTRQTDARLEHRRSSSDREGPDVADDNRRIAPDERMPPRPISALMNFPQCGRSRALKWVRFAKMRRKDGIAQNANVQTMPQRTLSRRELSCSSLRPVLALALARFARRCRSVAKAALPERRHPSRRLGIPRPRSPQLIDAALFTLIGAASEDDLDAPDLGAGGNSDGQGTRK
jgi:hypothetical protein